MSLIDLAGGAAETLLGDAAGPYVLLFSNARSIGGIIPNVTVREVLTDEDTITQHPVESGTPIADHVFANPKIIEMSSGWSDSTAGYPGYVQDVYQAILALKATREPFDVSTGKRAYQNMLFGNVTAVTDEQSEHTLMVTARLQEVIITTTDDGSSSSTDPQTTGSSTAGGTQPSTPYGQGGIDGGGKFTSGAPSG